MEGSVATKEAPPEPTPSFDGAAEGTRSTEELFQWCQFVHVGTGAKECEGGENGSCRDPAHFHCWLTLPNLFQQRDITTKADAARARKRRSLKDPESDASAVLEEQLGAWEANDESFEVLLRTMATRTVQPEILDIRQGLVDTDRFEHIDADIEELTRLVREPDDERDAEEFTRLRDHVQAFRNELSAGIETRINGEVEALKRRPREEVLKRERDWEIDNECGDAYITTMYTWTYYYCARKPVKNGYPTERIFAKAEELKLAAPEVVVALRDSYRDLETRMTVARSDAAGN